MDLLLVLLFLVASSVAFTVPFEQFPDEFLGTVTSLLGAKDYAGSRGVSREDDSGRSDFGKSSIALLGIGTGEAGTFKVTRAEQGFVSFFNVFEFDLDGDLVAGCVGVVNNGGGGSSQRVSDHQLFGQWEIDRDARVLNGLALDVLGEVVHHISSLNEVNQCEQSDESEEEDLELSTTTISHLAACVIAWRSVFGSASSSATGSHTGSETSKARGVGLIANAEFTSLFDGSYAEIPGLVLEERCLDVVAVRGELMRHVISSSILLDPSKERLRVVGVGDRFRLV